MLGDRAKELLKVHQLEHLRDAALRDLEELQAENTALRKRLAQAEESAKYRLKRMDQLLQDAEKAEAELARIKAATWCAYCGKEFPLDGVTAEQIGEHIRTCEKHPMRQVEVEKTLAENERDWEIAKRKEAEANKAVLLEALEKIDRAGYPGARFIAREAIAKITR